MLTEINFVLNSVTILNHSHLCLRRSNIEKVNEFPDESEDFICERVRANRSRPVHKEHEVRGLTGTGRLDRADPSRVQIGAAGNVHESAGTLTGVPIDQIHTI